MTVWTCKLLFGLLFLAAAVGCGSSEAAIPTPEPTPTANPHVQELMELSSQAAPLAGALHDAMGDVDRLALNICPSYLWDLARLYQDDARRAYEGWLYRIDQRADDAATHTVEENIENLTAFIADAEAALVVVNETKDELEDACLQESSN